MKALLTKGDNLTTFSSEAPYQPKISILDIIEITAINSSTKAVPSGGNF